MDQMFYVLLSAFILITGYVLLKAYKDRKQLESISILVRELVNANDLMHKTLLLGLYHRFKKSKDTKGDENSDSNEDFANFVAKIMESLYGGSTIVISPTQDYGMDLIHQRHNGTYLGHIKCNQPDDKVNYEPIALIHSKMIKEDADYGFIVTTSTFTSEAKKYAEGLNIQLIEGDELVRLWAQSLETQRKFIPNVAT